MATVQLQPEIPYKAYSGSNIIATINGRRVFPLQAITCSITREVAALYSFGDSNPKAFVRGKRGIAGTLVFTQYDRSPTLRDVFEGAFESPLSQVNPLFRSRFLDSQFDTNLLASESIPTRNFSTGQQIANFANAQFDAGIHSELQREIESVYNMIRNQRLRYSDQIPEFDVTITMVDESGSASFCSIIGILLVNEGWAFTMDDLVSEVAHTYVARAVTPLTALRQENQRRNRTVTLGGAGGSGKN